jgi:hypothetical protein
MTTEEEKQKIISQHMSELGKKAARKNKKKGSAYFKWVRAHGKKKANHKQDQ